MSSHSNFKSNHCWSCEFFSAKREYKNGLVLGPSVSHDSIGTCSCKRSPKFNTKVNESGYCSKYQKWGVLQSYLASEQNKVEIQKANAAILKQQDDFKKEQIRIQENADYERRKAEHDAWLASLSPEELADYKEKQRIQKEEAENNLRERLREIEAKNAAKKKKIKRFGIIGGIIAAIVALVITVSILIANAVSTSNYNNSPEGKLRNYINTNGKNNVYAERWGEDVLGSGFSIMYNLSYSDDGYTESTGAGAYAIKGEKKFLLQAKVEKMPYLTSSELYAAIVFNYEDLEKLSLYACGEVHFGKNTAYHHYQGINISNLSNPTYRSVWNTYGSWDNTLDLATSQKEGFKAVYSGLLFINEISNRLNK